MWRSFSGRPIDDIAAEVRSVLNGSPAAVHIGTDSRSRGIHTEFATAVAVLHPGWGGFVYYRRERGPNTRSVPHKLFRETELSITAAQALDGASNGHPIVVHVDANEDVRHLSSRYVRALAGMVVGFGYDVRVKPDSWCASHVAHHVVSERRRRAAG